MKLLGDTKKVQSSALSPDRTAKGATTTAGTSMLFTSSEENPINMLLFGNKMSRSSTMMSGMMS
jgi:hypothetical protein